MAETEDVGFADGFPWLPSYLLNTSFNEYEELKYYDNYKRRQPHRKTPPPPGSRPFSVDSRSVLRTEGRRCFTNWATGGPGMQAVFLNSGRRPCGTGVFLPRRAGTNVHVSNKPAPPVLLPSRVVQALNLNVHELGKHNTPQGASAKNLKTTDSNAVSNKFGGKMSSEFCSPEIFLPKEWTY